MALSNELMRSLLAKTPDKATNALVRVDDGSRSGKLVAMEVKSSTFGKFEGKSAPLRRSRKGHVTRGPGGSRFYVHNFDTEVVAYKV